MELIFTRVRPLAFTVLLAFGSVSCAGPNDAASAADAAQAQAEAAKAKVPDGTPEEIFAFMRDNRTLNPIDDSAAAELAAFREASSTLLEGAEKVLAHKDATPEQKEMAYQYKIGLLSQGAMRYDLADYAKRLRKVADQLRAIDPKSDLAASAAASVVMLSLGTSGANFTDAIPAIKGFSEAFPGNIEVLRRLFTIGTEADEQGNDDLARSAYGVILKTFPDHPVVEALAGPLRRLGLVGKPMELAAKTLDGKPFDIKSLKGKVVLVDFWATWCGPCVAEMPNVVALYEKYHDRGFEVVGVSLDHNRADLEDFIETEEIPWRQIFFDPGEAGESENAIADYYGVSGIPTMFLIGRSGKVVSIRARGEALRQQLAEMFEASDEKPVATE